MSGQLRCRILRACERSIPAALLLTAITLPFSVRLYFSTVNLELIFPVEPLIGLLVGLQLVAVLLRDDWRARLVRMRNPLVLIAGAWLLVLGASAFASEYTLVSVKAMAVRTAFAMAFLFLPLLLPAVSDALVHRALRAHAFSFLFIAGYSLVRQFDAGFGREGAGLAPFPFYVDHTSYATALTFVLLLFLGDAFRPGWLDPRRFRPYLAILTAFALIAFVLSFSRGAWISLLVALAAWPLVCMRRRFLVLTAAASILVVGLFAAWVLRGAAPELADSTGTGAGFKASVLSLSNVHSDTSNKERLNRWKCSVRMFKDRPWTGHGVGTFQFVFPPYQREEEMTYISVTTPVDPSRVQRVWSWSDDLFIRRNPQNLYCSGGTAHSEYLLALSESGLLAFLLFALLAAAVAVIGHQTLRMSEPGRMRTRYAVAWLALLAYFVHAFFNNFLDDPKVAFLFWTAMLLMVRGSSYGQSIKPVAG